jgi:hypothetical protein
MTKKSTANYPLFTNNEILDLSDSDLQYNINEFQTYIRREKRLGRSTKDAEVECAYLMNERDLRNQN